MIDGQAQGIAAILPGAPAAASVPATPGWNARPATYESLRARRDRRRYTAAVAKGDWRRVLLDWATTQHKYKDLMKTNGSIGTFLIHFNIVGKCANLIADFTANTAPSFTTDEINPQQMECIEDISRRSLLPARFREAMIKVIVESECVMRTDLEARASGVGAVVCVENNDVAFPMGDVGADGQPRVLERRWITKRGEGRERKIYLNVERYRELNGDWVREREAYLTSSTDVLMDLAQLRRVSLIDAGAPESESDLRVIPIKHAPFIWFVRGLDDGEPVASISEHANSLFDSMAASLTRLARAMEQHGSPKQRIPESMVDKKTNRAINTDAAVDPDKEWEYLVATFNFDALLRTAETFMALVCVDMDVSPGLIGLKMANVTQADTAEKVELEAKPTIAACERSRPYVEASIARLLTAACELDSSLPARGHRVSNVSATMTIGLPKSTDEREREAMNRGDRGYDSKIGVLREIHKDEADRVQNELDQQQAKEDARQRALAFGAVGLTTDAAEPEEPEVSDAIEPTELETEDAA